MITSLWLGRNYCFPNWIFASQIRICFGVNRGFRALAIDSGTLCSDVVCWPMMLTPNSGQLGGTPVGGLLAREFGAESRCEVVVLG